MKTIWLQTLVTVLICGTIAVSNEFANLTQGALGGGDSLRQSRDQGRSGASGGKDGLPLDGFDGQLFKNKFEQTSRVDPEVRVGAAIRFPDIKAWMPLKTDELETILGQAFPGVTKLRVDAVPGLPVFKVLILGTAPKVQGNTSLSPSEYERHYLTVVKAAFTETVAFGIKNQTLTKEFILVTPSESMICDGPKGVNEGGPYNKSMTSDAALKIRVENVRRRLADKLSDYWGIK
ncbi:hypothetical protein QPK87_19045 [Kamptonema cortianum]|nr:hypothetical protein [Geitlerinema splendidum]MDK3158653.1 hypothetical protein [Kamptonema cortianum]